MSDVIIVGAGAVGCLTAMELVKRGAKVTLVDRGEPGMESTWAGGGILFPLLPWNYRDEVNQLALGGARAYPELAELLKRETGIDPEYTVSGMLIHDIQRSADVATALDWCAQHAIRHELRDQQLYLPDVAQIRNPRLAHALLRWLEQHQVTITSQTTISSIVKNTAMVTGLMTSDGQLLKAAHIVITAGAWSKGILGSDAPEIELKPMRGQMLLYKLPENTLQHIVYKNNFYLIPRRDGHILAGSTVEDVGFDKSTTSHAVAELQQKAADCFPALRDISPVQQWSGLRPGSPDNIPVIQRHATLSNLWLNTGHFRYGVTMAPASAGMLADLMQK